MMPAQAAHYRAEQITFLSGEMHHLRTDKAFGGLLQETVSSDWLCSQDADIQANVHELKREFDKATKIPHSLVERMANACSLGQMTWVDARKTDDFAKFLPTLKLIFDLKREYADAVGYGESRYDALFDDYEPHAQSSKVAVVLRSLCDSLVPLLQKIRDSTDRPNVSVLSRQFPTADQATFGKMAAEKIGFDFQRGRLDVTHHPFCTEMGPNDCRITTRYDEVFFNTAFFGILHEAGHGIYEQGLRSEHYGLPSGKFASLGVHESQSRLWENLVGRNRQFWNHFFPMAQSRFGHALNDISVDEFYRAINDVRPSLIRVEADEVTYDLHIVIRFELELAIINGELDCADLPAAWNEKYEKYLGVTPQNNAQGVMQDIHWSAGLIGYFPTYSLGNLYAAQIFEAATQQLGDLDTMFAKGDFVPLKNWLNQNIHRAGQTLEPAELIRAATGTELSHEPLVKRLTQKYAEVFGIS